MRILANQGFNVAVLAAIEQRLLMQAIAQREQKGLVDHPSDALHDHAERLMPQGAQLYMLYTEVRGGMARQPLQDLEEISRNLELAASHLEKAAVKNLVVTEALPLGDKVAARAGIATRYAQLLEAARTLEESGVVPVFQRGRLANLTDRPAGPLLPYYDKACTLLEDRQSKADRLRMAA